MDVDPVLATPPARLPGMVGYVLRRTQLAVFRDFLLATEHLAITPAQFSLLTVAAERPGLKQTDLALALDVKRANMVAMLDAMETRGLVTRKPVPHDARSHSVEITPAGRALLRRLDAAIDAHEAKITAGLGAEGRARLLALLEAVIANCAEP